MILPQRTVGWLSQNTMDVLRERLLKRLYEIDRHDRLRVYYPHVPGLGTQCINVHAKVLVIDDELLRAGSANFNNRSMGLDTECDLAIEARGESASAKASRRCVIACWPGTLALTVFSDQVVAAIAAPETIRFSSLLVLAVIIAAVTWWLSRWYVLDGSQAEPGLTVDRIIPEILRDGSYPDIAPLAALTR